MLEREPMRTLQIQNPSTYQGQFGDKGSSEQTYDDGNYFINGLFNCANGGFLSGFFVKEIANTNIVVGPYPLYEIDVNKIAATGAQAVINL